MLPRFHHVLVPLDFTEKNRAALEVAFDLAVHHHARVTLLHVIEPISGADGELQAFTTRLRQRAESELEARAQRFAEAVQKVEWKVIEGHRLEEIVRASVDRSADLIVMSSHRPVPRSPGTPSATRSRSCAVARFCL